MSSTNRSNARDGHVSDYYITPIDEIEKFIISMIKSDDKIFTGHILDPCAGGDECHLMSYPTAINNILGNLSIDTIDIREDSLANTKGNYLQKDCKGKYQTIISNPPFNSAIHIIEKALDDVLPYGFVVMLQRLNFLGSIQRRKFWEAYMPKYIYVHHKRMGFTNDGRKDSIEYAHYVWQKGYDAKSSRLYII